MSELSSTGALYCASIQDFKTPSTNRWMMVEDHRLGTVAHRIACVQIFDDFDVTSSRVVYAHYSGENCKKKRKLDQ